MTDAQSESFKEKLYKFSKVLYWVIGLGIVVALCYYLYNVLQRPITSILLFMGGFMLVYFYWIKWFKLPEVSPNWPPTINPCPDYLTLVLINDPANPGTQKPICKDYVGISSNGLLQKSAPGSTGITDPNSYIDVSAVKTNLEGVCEDVRRKGLTWMGVCAED